MALAPAPEYVIGPNDTLSVLFWHDKDMSADVVVRPDGNISLTLLLGVDSDSSAVEIGVRFRSDTNGVLTLE